MRDYVLSTARFCPGMVEGTSLSANIGVHRCHRHRGGGCRHRVVMMGPKSRSGWPLVFGRRASAKRWSRPIRTLTEARSQDLTLRRPYSPHLHIFTLLASLTPFAPVTAHEAGIDEPDSLRNKRLHHPRHRRQPCPLTTLPSREQPILKRSRDHAIATNVRERLWQKNTKFGGALMTILPLSSIALVTDFGLLIS